MLRDALIGSRDAGSARRWIDRRLTDPEGAATDRDACGAQPLRHGQCGLHGRAAGDALLRAAFKRIEEAAVGALVARLGGSEFLAVAIEDVGIGGSIWRPNGSRANPARPFVTGDTIAER